MTDDIKVTVGGTLKDDLAAFRSAWEQAERGERGEPVQSQRVLAFESWQGLASIMTGERYRLLRHLHAQPEPSVSALARHLGRHLRRVQEDVRTLEQAGLVDRSQGMVRAAADRISVGIDL
jgi:predicted transcriptional regulator